MGQLVEEGGTFIWQMKGGKARFASRRALENYLSGRVYLARILSKGLWLTKWATSVALPYWVFFQAWPDAGYAGFTACAIALIGLHRVQLHAVTFSRNQSAEILSYALQSGRDVADEMPFSLWLRPFEADNHYREERKWYSVFFPLDVRNARPDWENELEMVFTHVMEKELSNHGEPLPLLAIGSTQGQRGAARAWIPTEHWQDFVVLAVRQARCVLLVAGYSEGLLWELQHLIVNRMIHKVVLIVPSSSRPGEGASRSQSSFNAAEGWRLLRDELSRASIRDLPAESDLGFALRFEDDLAFRLRLPTNYRETEPMARFVSQALADRDPA